MDRDSLEFAVVDVETTGLFPGGSDRIVEIAVVRLAGDGTVIGEFCSLINPDRDIGPSHVHGIAAGDALLAPRFSDVAGHILDLLAGAVFVAHNASFDARFTRAEFTRAGLRVPEYATLCTMQLARRVDPNVPSRRLDDLCAYFDIPAGRSHSAHDDAHATARLLRACVELMAHGGEAPSLELGLSGRVAGRGEWPTRVATGMPLLRSEAETRRARKPNYLASLVARLPAHGESSPR